MKLFFGSILLGILALTQSSLGADVIRMKNGDVYRGDIIKIEPEKKVQILFKDGNEKSITWSEIEIIEKEPTVAAPQPPQPAPQSPSPPPLPQPETPLATTPAPTSSSSESYKKWWVFLSSGVTVANSSSYTLKNAGGTPLTATDDTADTSGMISFEGMNRINPVLGISVLIDWNKYNYKASATPADTATSLLVMPRIQTTGPKANLWAGLGFGYTHTTLGLYSLAITTYTITFDQGVDSLTISPRIGADFEISDRVSLGLQVFYTSTSGNIKGSVLNRSTGATAAFSEDVTRHWFGIGLRGGMNF